MWLKLKAIKISCPFLFFVVFFFSYECFVCCVFNDQKWYHMCVFLYIRHKNLSILVLRFFDLFVIMKRDTCLHTPFNAMLNEFSVLVYFFFMFGNKWYNNVIFVASIYIGNLIVFKWIFFLLLRHWHSIELLTMFLMDTVFDFDIKWFIE